MSSALVYTYDAAGNITSVTDGENVTRYCYDNMGQLIREDNPYSQKTCVYAYDSCGNILSRTEYGYTDDENPAGGTVTAYEYNNAAWGDQLTSWNGESITYDAIGNPLLYRGRSLTWTQGRRLAGVSSEGLAAYYTYDESGTRTGKTVNGVSTQYYINGSQILAQKRGEDILYFLYDETGSAVGFKYNNNLYLYRKNLQGDILAVLNGQTGAVEASYTYDAWGRVISSTGALAELNPFRYRGYYYDSETGLYYLQSRYYDPETGRFINADSIIDESNLNVNGFVYCYNNPIMHGDYDGMAPQSIWYKALKWVVGTVCAVVGVSFKVYRPLEYMGVKAAGTLGVCHILKAKGYKLSAMMFQHAMYGYGGKISAETQSMIIARVKSEQGFINTVLGRAGRYYGAGRKPNFSGTFEFGIQGRYPPDMESPYVKDLYLAVHRANYKVQYIRSKHLLRITVSDVFDFSELWFISNENTTIKNKILNDIGFCLENAQFMRQFSWRVSFDMPYWG